jgi:hypothetical protein
MDTTTVAGETPARPGAGSASANEAVVLAGNAHGEARSSGSGTDRHGPASRPRVLPGRRPGRTLCFPRCWTSLELRFTA